MRARKHFVNVSHVLAALALLLLNSASAQFTDISTLLGGPHQFSNSPHGEGLSFYDFNKDGWDDLTISLADGDPLFLVNNQGVFEPAPFSIPNSHSSSISMMLWCDYDNDGDADLLITKFGGPLELWNNDGEFNFTNVATSAGLMAGNFFHVGAAFCDYDHDGCPDLYISKFYHPSFNIGPQFEGKLYRNNCDGTFTDVTIESGVQIPPRPSFQPVFLDYNNDGWEDLFIVIDRVFWPNELFENNGDGTFTRVTIESGFDFNICAMTGTVDDFDNDGDLDIYITNNPGVGTKLMQNNGDGTFEDVAQEMGVHLNEVTWGSLWLDYDNDSWQDLFVGVTSPVQTPIGNQFFVNQQGSIFTQENELLGIDNDPSETYVCARGDLNNDGYFDFIISNRWPHHVRLYENDGGTNNYLSVSVEGTLSNKDGIGTWIHCYADGNHYVRFTMCGENLISQNSGKEIFGLGTIETVDSLVITWNRGTTHTFYNLNVNQHLHFIEGETYDTPYAIHNQDTVYLCPGDTLVLNAGEHENFVWSTGADSALIEITEPGTYYLQSLNDYGVWVPSFPVEVLFAPEPEINFNANHIHCYGGSNGSIYLEVSTAPLSDLVWNTGHNSGFLDNLLSGSYSFYATDDYGCAVTDSINLSQPDSLWISPQITNVSCFGESNGSVMLETFGGTPPYLSQWGGINPITLPSGWYEVGVVDWMGCEASVLFWIQEPDSLQVEYTHTFSVSDGETGIVEISTIGGTPPYSNFWSNGWSDVWYSDEVPPGAYDVEVLDDQGCAFWISFVIETTANIGEHHALQWQLFPNPSGQYVYLRKPGCVERFDVRILNHLGQVVASRNLLNCHEAIDVSSLASGAYFVVVGESTEQVLRFVKLP